MENSSQPIYHLTPAGYYNTQPQDQPYRPETFAQEGFIHCTAGTEMLVEVANAFFDTLLESLLALEIDPQRLTAPLQFESPIPPTGQAPADEETFAPDPDLLFPHIYGPLNREAIVDCFVLQRGQSGRWYLPE